jgi:hypothetical protein
MISKMLHTYLPLRAGKVGSIEGQVLGLNPLPLNKK